MPKPKQPTNGPSSYSNVRARAPMPVQACHANPNPREFKYSSEQYQEFMQYPQRFRVAVLPNGQRQVVWPNGDYMILPGANLL
jgi:hypothetical protein